MKVFVGAVLAALIAVPAFAQKGVDARLRAATEDLRAMVNASDKGIPTDLLNRASCVIVVPNMKAGGFIIGGEYGKGFFTCRNRSGVGWSAPGCITISGGKFGLLIGGKETDLVMLVMNRDGMEHLLSDHFDLGGEASAAAGPVGRSASAMTDAEMHAEILTYSRSQGIFGGLDLSGSVIKEDKSAIRDLYGKDLTNREILNDHVHVPAEADQFIHVLDRISSRK